jgi:uncharacterized protein
MSENYNDFLLAVVNAEERADFRGARKRFVHLYSKRFPASGITLAEQELAYRLVREWWRSPSVHIPVETPDEQFGFHVVILRHKLRVIWAFADSGDAVGALRKSHHLLTEVHRYARRPTDLPHEEWRQWMLGACEWLQNVCLYKAARLKKCQNSECRTERYFIRKSSNNKYCCAACCQRSEEVRRLERRMNIPAKTPKRVLSDEGKQKIAEGQRERWRKFRASKASPNRMTPFAQPERLTDAELDRLGDFLKSCKRDKVMNLEELDGFFSALIAGPESVLPSEYNREVFGGEMSEAVAFASLDDAQEIMNLMMRHRNTIAGALSKDEIHVPLILEDETGDRKGNDWALGFARGMEMRHEGWSEFVNDEQHRGCLVPMILLCLEHEKDPKMHPHPITLEKLEQIIARLAVGLQGAYKYFRQKREADLGVHAAEP